MKFQLIIADPPYRFDDTISMSDVPRGAEANYTTMSNADIMALPIQEIADPNGCVLALWCPSSLLQTGLDLMKTWGFEQKQTYIWCKTKKVPLGDIMTNIRAGLHKTLDGKTHIADVVREAMQSFSLTDALGFGMGRLFRQSHELCLIGINDTAIYKRLENRSQRSVSFAENLKHSAKPERLQDSLELMFPKVGKDDDPKYLEIFARRERTGWTCIGNECASTMGEDVRVSLERLRSQ